MFYKDYIVDRIRSRRPKKIFFTYPCIDILYLDTLRNLFKLRRKFIENNTKITYQNKIPISKMLFDKFLELSYSNLTQTNKNIFLTLNGLEEWVL